MGAMSRMSSSAPAAAVGAVLPAGGAAEAAPAKYTHAQAAAELKKAGISWTSSGSCSNWNRSTCTSFTNINKATIAGVIAFKKASGCAVVITGGTEVGHSSGTYSHRNGYSSTSRSRTPA